VSWFLRALEQEDGSWECRSGSTELAVLPDEVSAVAFLSETAAGGVAPSQCPHLESNPLFASGSWATTGRAGAASTASTPNGLPRGGCRSTASPECASRPRAGRGAVAEGDDPVHDDVADAD
jgi:hypothetical protein